MQITVCDRCKRREDGANFIHGRFGPGGEVVFCHPCYGQFKDGFLKGSPVGLPAEIFMSISLEK